MFVPTEGEKFLVPVLPALGQNVPADVRHNSIMTLMIQGQFSLEISL